MLNVLSSIRLDAATSRGRPGWRVQEGLRARGRGSYLSMLGRDGDGGALGQRGGAEGHEGVS